MEWGHRMLGRFIGLSVIIPGLYFARKGYLSRKMKWRTLGIASMVGTQGVIGWLMVKSGLDDEIMNTPHAVPRVNHLWLSGHLASAFLIYAAMLLTGFEILAQNKKVYFINKA